ncbi:MAG: Asp-tRNA(Asn)/Glu-tRNA(Gln) amidotransferase subunit GatC [Candidatus Saccharibacteria bacterium]
MTKVSKDIVENIARLSRIGMDSQELELMSRDITSILDFVETLESVDTESVQPTSQVTGLKDVWREDKVNNCRITRDEILANAPQTKDGYILVKKVL